MTPLRKLVGAAPNWLNLMELVQRVGRSEATVLLQGETGTGKEMIARAIHDVRRQGNFVAVDCTALTSTLVESELFGFAKGSFTGALQDRPGILSEADGGTAFFDEIGELPLEAQSKLLRVLQEREIRPIGRRQPVPCSFRVIAATNRDLQDEVRSGRFRLDLYHRLNVVTLDIPPLRERRSDIPAVVAHFLEKGGTSHVIPAAVMSAFESHDWPGNVRELENCITRLVALSPDSFLHTEHLPNWWTQAEVKENQGALGEPHSAFGQIRSDFSIAAAELNAIELALQASEGRVAEAAKVLGIGRTTLYRRLHHSGRWCTRSEDQPGRAPSAFDFPLEAAVRC